MKLAIFNGSPRGTHSNTQVLVQHFAAGVHRAIPDADIQNFYLNRTRHFDTYAQAYQCATHVLLAFPMYVHAMPSVVKEFMEYLCETRPTANPHLAYMVQFGFTEAAQARFLEPVLPKFAKRIGARYAGSFVKGGMEGTRLMPGWMISRRLQAIEKLGASFALHNKLPADLLKQMRKPEVLSENYLRARRIFQGLGMNNIYWNRQLKANNAYEQRFAKPYAPQ